MRYRYDTCSHYEKYQKHPSTTKLKHANVLTKEIISPYVRLLNLILYYAYSISIHGHKMTISEIVHKQKEENYVIQKKIH